MSFKETHVDHIKQRLWWEQWEDAEPTRLSDNFYPYASDYDKIIAAAADFTSGRVWPDTGDFAQSGPKYIWEKFQYYLGIQEGAADEDKDEDVPASGKPTVTQNLKAFFDDPEKSIKIFMSSYSRPPGYACFSRSMGHIWGDPDLDYIPQVLHYFVRFLLRSKVFPLMERELNLCLKTITLAMIELPNTLNIANTFPDKFSLACNACWGQKSVGYMTPVVNAVEEPEAKGQKCDTEMAQPQPAAPATKGTADAWNNVDTIGWGVGPWSEEKLTWPKIDKSDSLISLLGLNDLPLTHSPGIIERSIRRVTSIARPPSSAAKSSPLPDGIYEPNADAVELDLDRRFAKLVLAPMLDWDGGDPTSPICSKPAVFQASGGAGVIQDRNPTTASATLVQGGSRPHDPTSDEITVLIEPIASQMDYLREGMAIGGTWVQLVRQGEPAVVEKPSYWYLDKLVIVVPSSWAIVED